MVSAFGAIDRHGPAKFGCDQHQRFAPCRAKVSAKRHDHVVNAFQQSVQPPRLVDVRVPTIGLHHHDSCALRTVHQAGYQLASRRTAPACGINAFRHHLGLRGAGPKRRKLGILGIEHGDTLHQPGIGVGQARRRIAANLCRPAQCQRNGCRQRQCAPLSARKQSQQPVHPAIVAAIGSDSAAFEHILPVKMRSLAIA